MIQMRNGIPLFLDLCDDAVGFWIESSTKTKKTCSELALVWATGANTSRPRYLRRARHTKKSCLLVTHGHMVQVRRWMDMDDLGPIMTYPYLFRTFQAVLGRTTTTLLYIYNYIISAYWRLIDLISVCKWRWINTDGNVLTEGRLNI